MPASDITSTFDSFTTFTTSLVVCASRSFVAEMSFYVKKLGRGKFRALVFYSQLQVQLHNFLSSVLANMTCIVCKLTALDVKVLN